jgi:DNA-binding response OmpR family regulator
MPKLLIIEDHDGVRGMLRIWCENQGYQVFEAYDGFSGIQSAKAYQPDLIICDLVMPGVDGFDVLAALRQEFGDLTPPFIIVTANFDVIPSKSLNTPGISEIFPKPIPFKELQKAITRLLSSSVTPVD